MLLVVTAALILLVAGIGFLLIGSLPFASVKAFADRLSSDGNARGFTEVLYIGIARRAQQAGGILFLYSACFWLFRRHGARLLGGMRRALSRLANCFLAALANYWRTTSAWERWGFPLVLLAGAAVRLLFIQYPLRHDEAFTVEAYARMPLYRLITDLREPNNHLLHSFLVGISIRLFGDAEWAVRIPAFCAGCLAIAAAYVCFRRWAGGAAGLLAAALVASQSAQIEYSVLARGYSVIVLAFLSGLLVVSGWPARLHSPVRWWAFVLTVAFALCTVLSSVYMVSVLCAWYLARCWETKVHWRPALLTLFTALLAAAGIIVLFYLPAFIVTGPDQYRSSRFLQPNAYYYVIPRAIQLAGQIWTQWGEGWPPVLYWTLAALSVVGILLPRRILGTVVPLPLLAVAVCVALTLLQRLFHFRRSFLFLSPLFLGVAACTFTWLLNQIRLRAAIPGMIAGVFVLALGAVVANRSVYTSDEIGNARDIKEAADFLLTQKLNRSDHVSVTLVSSMPAIYYFRKAGIPVSVLDARGAAPRRIFSLEDKIPLSKDDQDPENIVTANRDLVLRIEGFDTALMPPPHLLWESTWCRIWLYDPQPL